MKHPSLFHANRRFLLHTELSDEARAKLKEYNARRASFLGDPTSGNWFSGEYVNERKCARSRLKFLLGRQKDMSRPPRLAHYECLARPSFSGTARLDSVETSGRCAGNTFDPVNRTMDFTKRSMVAMETTIENIPQDILQQAYCRRQWLRIYDDPEPEKLLFPGFEFTTTQRRILSVVRIFETFSGDDHSRLFVSPSMALLRRRYGDHYVSPEEQRTDSIWLGYLADPEPIRFQFDTKRFGSAVAEANLQKRKEAFYTDVPAPGSDW